MPSNGTKPFFIKHSLSDQYGDGMKAGKDPMTQLADTIDMEKIHSGFTPINYAPTVASMSTCVLNVRPTPAEQLFNNNQTSQDFQGFQFELPWAPHLSGINIGPQAFPPHSDSRHGSRVKSLPFDFDAQLGGSSPSSHVPQRSETITKSLPLNSRCFDLIKPHKKEQPAFTNLGIQRLQSLSNLNRKRNNCHLSNDCFPNSSDSDRTNVKRQRFLRTADALKKSGLLNVTMKSATLMEQNKRLQQEIDELRRETTEFMKSVLNNPENQHFLSLSFSK